MAEGESVSIGSGLGRLNFSRSAGLSQLLTDWLRLQNSLYINNQPLSVLCGKVGLNPYDGSTGSCCTNQIQGNIVSLYSHRSGNVR